MRYKMVDTKPKTFVMVFETNDELARGLKAFAAEQKLAAASFKAIGALSSVRLGWLNWETKQYEPSVSLNEQVELLSLIGDIALQDGEPQVHAHAVIGKRDGTAHGGHLLEAHVRPTCEVVLTESPAHLRKEFDPSAGIALIKL
jgi:predicted DNA-binding protein with PD1-like motif